MAFSSVTSSAYSRSPPTGMPLAILLTGISVGIVESTQARNKLVRNTTYIVTISALAALIFFVGYLLQLDINI